MHTNKEFRLVTTQLRVIANERRVAILFDLRRHRYTVLELSAKYNIHQTAMTKHLLRMSAAGFIEGKRSGKYVFFSVPSVVRNSRLLWEVLCRGVF